MALITRFDTPASLRDAPAGSVFYSNWHNFVASRLSTTPGSGTAVGEFYDASEVDVTVAAERNLVWMAFPRQVLVDRRDDRGAAFSFADSDVHGATPKTNTVSGT